MNYNPHQQTILYARSSVGVQLWSVEVKGSPGFGPAGIKVSYGKLGGKIQEKPDLIEKGKVNRTPYEQAISQATSKWNKKRDQGYKTPSEYGVNYNQKTGLYSDKSEKTYKTLLKALEANIPKARLDSQNRPKPMLAQPYRNVKTSRIQAKFPAYIQPKLNGARCLVVFDKNGVPTLLTRGGKEWNISHIKDSIKRLKIFNILQDSGVTNPILDGELYIHRETFENLMSYAKAPQNAPILSANLQYHIYDLGLNMTQVNRFKVLYNELYPVIHNDRYIKIVKAKVVKSNKDVEDLHKSYLNLKYEGSIIRDPNAVYQFKRTKALLKLKPVYQGEFQILDVKDSVFNPGIAIFIVRNDTNGEEFSVNSSGTVEERKEYFENKDKYVGQFATVDYRDRSTDKNIPIHATFVIIRDYE